MPRPQKRNMRKKTRKPRRQLSMAVCAAPVPARMTRLLKYFDLVQINPSLGGGVSGYSFRLNSVFDPDYTGIGHQPRGFDQFAALYSEYVVLSSKIKIIPTLNSGTANPVTVGIAVDPDSSIQTNIYDYVEFGKGRYITIAGPSQGQKENVLTMSYSSRKYWNQSPYNNEDQRALMTANPSNVTYGHIWAAGTEGSYDPANIYIQVEISYLVSFTDPKYVAIS